MAPSNSEVVFIVYCSEVGPFGGADKPSQSDKRFFTPDTVTETVLFALSQPNNCLLDETVLRPFGWEVLY